MRVLASDLLHRWVRGTAIVALAILAWAVFIPDGLYWTAILAASLTGAAVATGVLVRSRRAPSLAQVIASAVAPPVAVPAGCGYTSGVGIPPSPRGERKP